MGLAIEALISWHSTWIRRFVAPWVEINFYHSKDTKQMPNRAGIPYQHWKWVYQHLQGTPSQQQRFRDCLPKILLVVLARKFHSKKVFIPRGLFGYRAFLQLILHRIRTDPWKSPNIDPRNWVAEPFPPWLCGNLAPDISKLNKCSCWKMVSRHKVYKVLDTKEMKQQD